MEKTCDTSCCTGSCCGGYTLQLHNALVSRNRGVNRSREIQRFSYWPNDVSGLHRRCDLRMIDSQQSQRISGKGAAKDRTSLGYCAFNAQRKTPNKEVHVMKYSRRDVRGKAY